MKVYGQWHGGSSYVASYVEDREVFPSERQARYALADRESSGHWQTQVFDYANRPAEASLCPCVDKTSYIDLYADAQSEDIIGRLYFGPRGGIRKDIG